MSQPTLYIIAGCNGAGKTTASMTVLPMALECTQFVNADEIARGLSPLAPQTVAIHAGKIMLTRIKELLSLGETFALETTLASRSYGPLVHHAHELGYQVKLLFIWLSSPAQAKIRVAQRVADGGHGIPSEIIERRYHAGLHNLFNIFIPIVDEWAIVDNSEGLNIPIATDSDILDLEKYQQIKLQSK